MQCPSSYHPILYVRQEGRQEGLLKKIALLIKFNSLIVQYPSHR